MGWVTRGPTVLRRSYHFAVLRYTAAGRLDRRFGRGGRIATKTGAQALAAFPVGQRRLLVVGTDSNPTGKLRGFVVFADYLVR